MSHQRTLSISRRNVPVDVEIRREALPALSR
jgi:hypothetical protein